MNTPVRTYFMVLAALFVLLAVTVGVSFVDLGPFNIVLALSIASAKALLVVLYFMDVRFSGQTTRLMAVAGVIWLALLIGGTLMDVGTRLLETVNLG